MNVTITNASLDTSDGRTALLVKVASPADAIEANLATEALVGRVPLYFARTGACVDDNTDVILTSADGSTFLGRTVDALDLAEDNDMQLWIELD